MKLENTFTIEAPIEKAWTALNTPEMIAPCFPGATLTEYEGDSFSGTVKVKLGPISLTYKGKGTYVERDDAAHRVVIDASGRDSRGNGTASATVTGSLSADGADKTSVTMVTDMTITGRPAQFGRGVISDVADKIIGQFAGCVAKKLTTQDEAATSPAAAPPSTESSAADAAETGAASSAPPVAGADPGRTNGAATATSGTATATATGPALSSTPASTVAPAPSAPAASGTRTSTGPLRSEIDAIDLLDTAGAPVLKRLAPVAGGGVLLLVVVLLVKRLRRS